MEPDHRWETPHEKQSGADVSTNGLMRLLRARLLEISHGSKD
jgi:hypothetical protein